MASAGHKRPLRFHPLKCAKARKACSVQAPSQRGEQTETSAAQIRPGFFTARGKAIVYLSKLARNALAVEVRRASPFVAPPAAKTDRRLAVCFRPHPNHEKTLPCRVRCPPVRPQ